MQLMGGFIQEAVTSGSPAVLQSMCNAVLDVVLLFTSPSPKLLEQLQQVTSGPHRPPTPPRRPPPPPPPPRRPPAGRRRPPGGAMS